MLGGCGGVWWLWRAPGGLVGHSQPVEGGCCACIHNLWERAVGSIYGCDGEERDRSPDGQCLVWGPSPQSFVWPFSSPLVRPEGDFFSDTNISRTKPKKQQWGGTGVNWELPSPSQPHAVPQAQDPGCSSSLDVPVVTVTLVLLLVLTHSPCQGGGVGKGLAP